MTEEPFWISRPRPGLSGTLTVPGDKSVSHRALLFNAIADGDAAVTGLLEGEDCLATLAALRAMGVVIEQQGSGAYRVHGRGSHGLRAPAAPLDLGNSGTGMRLLAGLLAGQRFPSVLIGDESLSRRPMARIIRPLSAMGAAIRGRGNRPPLHIEPAERLSPIRYGMPVASAQVKSALLLAALYADGETEIVQPGPSRDHSERLLAAMGADIDVDGLTVRLRGPARLAAADIAVPGDLSSAAFTLVAASVVAESDVTLPAVGINPTRRGVLDILGRMGAPIVRSLPSSICAPIRPRMS
ncbi:MAG: 3-phosphoshikimate 1-carboxyvinyltransferase, partial [Pseudomonadota bacterium]